MERGAYRSPVHLSLLAALKSRRLQKPYVGRDDVAVGWAVGVFQRPCASPMPFRGTRSGGSGGGGGSGVGAAGEGKETTHGMIMVGIGMVAAVAAAAVSSPRPPRPLHPSKRLHRFLIHFFFNFDLQATNDLYGSVLSAYTINALPPQCKEH